MPNVYRNFLTISDISEETWIEIAATFTQRDATFLTKFVPDGAHDIRNAREHWGTKWDVYEVQEDFSEQTPSTIFSAHFNTANGTLNKSCLEVLSRRFSGATIVNIIICEAWEDAGVCVIENGTFKEYWLTDDDLMSLKTIAYENSPKASFNPVDKLCKLHEQGIEFLTEYVHGQYKEEFMQWLHIQGEPFRQAQQNLMALAHFLQQQI